MSSLSTDSGAAIGQHVLVELHTSPELGTFADDADKLIRTQDQMASEDFC